MKLIYDEDDGKVTKCLHPHCECLDSCEASDPFMTAQYLCPECKEPCKSVEETFDYAGTHCTNGESGTHRTGNYVSDCCGADLN